MVLGCKAAGRVVPECTTWMYLSTQSTSTSSIAAPAQPLVHRQNSTGIDNKHASGTEVALHIHNLQVDGRFGLGHSTRPRSSSSLNATAGNSTRHNSQSPERPSKADLDRYPNSSGDLSNSVSHHAGEYGPKVVSQRGVKERETSPSGGIQFSSPEGLGHNRSSSDRLP